MLKFSSFSDLLNFPILKKFFKILSSHDADARLVGGCVRNLLLCHPIDDIDIAINIPPHEIIKLFQPYAKIIDTGMKYGTVSVVLDKIPLQITSLRKEISHDGRHAVMLFGTSFEEDAQRRDFTFNALYLDKNGKLFDYFDGEKDLHQGIVRFIGNPDQRIQEDYLRILRYFRFHSYYGKKIDHLSKQACFSHKDGLKFLSRERIRQEFFKIINSPQEYVTLKEMNILNILSTLLKEANFLLYSSFYKIVVDNDLSVDPIYKILSLYNETPVHILKESFALTARETKHIINVKKNPSGYIQTQKCEKLLYFLKDKDYLSSLLCFDFAQKSVISYDQVKEYLESIKNCSIPSFPLISGDLSSKGIHGKTLGSLLKLCENYWIEKNFLPTREDLIAYALRHIL